MADELPDFSLHFSFLEDKYESELLASIDIDKCINSGTNQVVEGETTDNVTENSTELGNSNNQTVQNNRFIKMSGAEIDDIITRAESKNTKENTKWAVRVFHGKFYLVK